MPNHFFVCDHKMTRDPELRAVERVTERDVLGQEVGGGKGAVVIVDVVDINIGNSSDSLVENCGGKASG